ncbi:hypothetical protein [uncultured Roseovarius sp.]|uniref:hypothetical protein n=1 Tax=uncultured Roseovarius sp. TaxID=293344 RepID=UPI00262F9118|nr:hypothetical protein [uncultured Roseovarius sp.]
MIRKHFIAGLSALAIGSVGLTAAPAQASDDTAKIVTGVAALALLGTVIAKSGQKDRRDHALSRSHSRTYYGHGTYRPHRYKSARGHHRYKSRKGHHAYRYKHHRKHGGYRYKKRY